MARLTVDTDSEDEMLVEFGRHTRHEKIVRTRPNYFDDLNDNDFFIKFRLTKPTVLKLLEMIIDQLEYPTNRNDHVSVSPINQLLLTLRFYATGTFLVVVGDFTGVHKSTASRIVHRVTTAISALRATYVRFPETEPEINRIVYGFYQKAKFPRALGAIDCTHVKIQSPGGDHAEEYRNRKGYFSFNVQTVSDHRLKIMDVVARWPGSVQDATIFNNSYLRARFESGMFGNNILLCDSGYGCSSYMIPPLRHPVLAEEQLFNEAQIRSRNVVERQYGVWKRRFPILAYGIRLKLSSVQGIVVACAVLHNIAIEEKEDVPSTDPEMLDSIEAAIEGGQIESDYMPESSRQIFVNYFRSRIQ